MSTHAVVRDLEETEAALAQRVPSESTCWSGLAASELQQVAAAAWRMQQRLMGAFVLPALAEASRRRLFREEDASSMRDLVSAWLRCPPATAGRLVKLGEHLSRPSFGATAESLAAGEIDVEAARAVVSAVRELPEAVVSDEQRAEGEQTMLGLARTADADVVGKSAPRLLEAVAPQEAAERADRKAERERDRAESMRWVDISGVGVAGAKEFRLRAETAVIDKLTRLIEPLTEPLPPEATSTEMSDLRPVERRRADATAELVDLWWAPDPVRELTEHLTAEQLASLVSAAAEGGGENARAAVAALDEQDGPSAYGVVDCEEETGPAGPANDAAAVDGPAAPADGPDAARWSGTVAGSSPPPAGQGTRRDRTWCDRCECWRPERPRMVVRAELRPRLGSATELDAVAGRDDAAGLDGVVGADRPGPAAGRDTPAGIPRIGRVGDRAGARWLSNAQTDRDDGRLAPERAEYEACLSDLVPVWVTQGGKPVAVASTTRFFRGKQLAALVARDFGCAFPGCTRGLRFIHAHHVTPFRISGRTTADDGVLLCPFHHKLIHDTDSGWQVRIAGDGLPEFVPPVRVDPARTPRRNLRHRRPAAA